MSRETDERRTDHQTDQMGIGTSQLARIGGATIATVSTTVSGTGPSAVYTEAWTVQNATAMRMLSGQSVASLTSTQTSSRAREAQTVAMVFTYDPLPGAAAVAAIPDPVAGATVLNRRIFNSAAAMQSGDSKQVTGWLHREIAPDHTVRDAWVLAGDYGLPSCTGDTRYFTDEVPASESWPSQRAFYTAMLQRGLGDTGRSVRVTWRLA